MLRFSRFLIPSLLLALLAIGSLLVALYTPAGKQEWDIVAGQTARKAGWGSAGVFLLLLVSMRWWLRPLAAAADLAKPEVPKAWRVPAWHVVLATLVLLAMLVRLPLASNSMWWDELWNVRFTVAGEFRGEAKNKAVEVYRPTTFKRALWFYSKPANHPPATLMAKVSHEIWRKTTRAPEGAFSELAMRLPGVLCSLAGVVLLAVTLRRWGNPLAGVLAGLFMAIHPWLVRYGVDMRGYAIWEFTGPLLLLAAGELWQGNYRLRWWGSLGAGLLLSMWAQPVSVWFCISVGGSLVWHGLAQVPREQRFAFFARLGAVSLVAGALFSMLYLPCLAQTAHWGGRNGDPNLLTLGYARETLETVLFGASANFHFPLWQLLPTAAVALCCSLWGLYRLRQASRPLGNLLLSVVIGFSLFVGFFVVTNSFFYHRFILCIAPVFLLLLAWGMTALAGRWRFLGVLILAGLCLGWQQPLQNLASLPLAPWRQIAHFLTHDRPRLTVIGIGHGREALQLYARQAIEFDEDDPAAFEALIRKKRQSEPQTPIRVVVGNPELQAKNMPNFFAWLNGKNLRVEAKFYGVDGEKFVIYEWHH